MSYIYGLKHMVSWFKVWNLWLIDLKQTVDLSQWLVGQLTSFASAATLHEWPCLSHFQNNERALLHFQNNERVTLHFSTFPRLFALLFFYKEALQFHSSHGKLHGSYLREDIWNYRNPTWEILSCSSLDRHVKSTIFLSIAHSLKSTTALEIHSIIICDSDATISKASNNVFNGKPRDMSLRDEYVRSWLLIELLLLFM